MATQLCDVTDIEDIWSEKGLTFRVDDDRSGAREASEDALIQRSIDQASSLVFSILLVRYSETDIGGANPPTSTEPLIVRCTAVIASYRIAKHRGNPGNMGLKDDYDECLEMLKEIAKDNMKLPGFRPGQYGSTLPTVSNFRVDQRQPDRKIRVRRAASTGEPATPYAKQKYDDRNIDTRQR